MAEPGVFEAEFFCATCRTPFLNESPLDEEGRCRMCRLGATGFDAAYAYGAHDGALRRLIHLFKYEGMESLARPLGDFIAAAIPRDRSFDVITAVPMHWFRRWRRGYNQSELLAREVARRCGVPARGLLKRARLTPAQAGLSAAERRKNVAGAFRVPNADRIRGLRILLVDDVLTTGATVGACAAALKRAGAKHVSVLTLARADRRNGGPLKVVPRAPSGVS